jgi:glutathione S-transferase
MMEYKKLDFAAGLLVPGETNDEIVEWTGINSGPIVVHDDDQPIERWTDILFLIERLAPKPALIPEDARQRSDLFGMSHELNGEFGLGWNRRLLMFAPLMESGSAPDGIVRMSGKYNYNKADSARASDRIIRTLNLLDEQLTAQQTRGSEYFIGDSPSALDFYWTAFSNLIEIISWEAIPVPEDYRPLFAYDDAGVKKAFSPALRAHRDAFFQRYFKSPMEFL